ncbi:GspH/FimT family protein [Methylophaga sp. OBS4]|nr:GspH/FimT family protein [Methylophaga sp. OBS4]
MLRSQHVTGEVNTLVVLIYLARSEAIKRNQVVTICKSADKQNCGGNWSDGWIVFSDKNADGARDADEIVITSGQLGNNYLLSWSAFGSDNYIRFRTSGLTSSHNGTFKLCPDDGDERFARAVIVSKTARVRTSEDSNGDGIEEDSSGDNLVCS